MNRIILKCIPILLLVTASCSTQVGGVRKGQEFVSIKPVYKYGKMVYTSRGGVYPSSSRLIPVGTVFKVVDLYTEGDILTGDFITCHAKMMNIPDANDVSVDISAPLFDGRKRLRDPDDQYLREIP